VTNDRKKKKGPGRDSDPARSEGHFEAPWWVPNKGEKKSLVHMRQSSLCILWETETLSRGKALSLGGDLTGQHRGKGKALVGQNKCSSAVSISDWGEREDISGQTEAIEVMNERKARRQNKKRRRRGKIEEAKAS